MDAQLVLRLFLFFVMFASPLQAQNQTNQYTISLNSGIYHDGDGSGISYSRELIMMKKNHKFSINYLNTRLFNLLGPLPDQNLNSLDVKAMIFSRSKSFQIEMGFGIGPTWGTRTNDFFDRIGDDFINNQDIRIIDDLKEEKYFTIGFPFEIGLKYYPSQYFAIGTSFVANFNLKNMYYVAPLISLEIGNFR